MIRSFVIAFVLMLASLPLPARAQVISDQVDTERASSVLISEKAGIMPGETIHLGLYQALQEGWHVYWRNPGDSGLAMNAEWIVPEGWQIGTAKYAVPHKLITGPLMTFVHEGEAVFLFPVTAPATATPGTVERLSLKVDYAICSDICVIENVDLAIAIPVVSVAAGIDASGGDLVAAALEALPVDAPFVVSAFDYHGQPAIKFFLTDIPAGEAYYFPNGEGLISPTKRAVFQADETGLIAVFTPDFNYTEALPADLSGVLTFTPKGSDTSAAAFKVSAPFGAAPASLPIIKGAEPTASASPAAPGRKNLLTILGLALLGGLILNIMPCVFPVVFLKAHALAQSAGETQSLVRRNGLAYTAGVVLAFLAIAAVLLALRAGGEQLGWGYQLQHPLPISIFAIVMMLIGLNLAGLFEIGTSAQGLGDGLTRKGGTGGAFFTGLLAVAVAAPCVGPFLGGALSFALNAPGLTGLAVFGVMGLGLALPFLVISFVPALAKILPRPGAWMNNFRQFLAFPMFATCIWLIWTLTQMAGTTGLVTLLSAMLLVALGAWIYGLGQRGLSKSLVAKLMALVSVIIAGVLVSGIAIAPRQAININTPGSDISALPTDIYSAARLAQLRDAGTPVFLEFTAAWCVTCQANKITALKRPRVIEAFHNTGTVYLVADWTLRDPEITQSLESYGRSGVPLYVYYGAGAEQGKILPQVLSVDLLIKTLNN